MSHHSDDCLRRNEEKRMREERDHYREESMKLRAALATARDEALEEAAKTAEEWADGQDRVALLKHDDAPCSAESHAESAIIGRRLAHVIRAMKQTKESK